MTGTRELVAVPVDTGTAVHMDAGGICDHVGIALERLSRRLSGRKASCHGFSRTDGCGRQSDLVRKKVGAE